MTLRDLLKKCRYKDVFNIIHQEYYGGKKSDCIYGADAGYRKVFGELLMLPDKDSSEYQIYIQLRSLGFDESEADETIDVCLYCNEDELTYAMDLTPWEELIDAEIKLNLPLNDASILAHILWEITFHGFSPEAINKAKDELIEIEKGIDSGETELIPWEDVKKELGIDDE